MSDLIRIAVDAMGGDGSPKKVIDGIIHNHNLDKSSFYKIFGNEEIINNCISISDGKKKFKKRANWSCHQ